MEQEKTVVRTRRSLWAMASDLEVVPSVAHWYRSQAAERSILMKLAPVAQEGIHGGGWRRAGPGGGRPPNPAPSGPGAAIDDSGPDRATSEQLWYVAAASSRRADTATLSLACRLRLFTLDRWNLWHRLTRYRTWTGPDDEALDGTNDATERATGWWVEEWYCPMRGCKRSRSVGHVSRLIVWKTIGVRPFSRPIPHSEQSRCMNRGR